MQGRVASRLPTIHGAVNDPASTTRLNSLPPGSPQGDDARANERSTDPFTQMRTRLFPFISLLALAVVAVTARAQGPAAAPEADTARVTLNAVDQPLGEVLAALSTQIGRPIILRNGADVKVRLSGQGIPLSAAMRLLVRGYGLVAAWNDGKLYVAIPHSDLERLRATPTPEVVSAFGEIYGPLLAAGPGPYLPEPERGKLIDSMADTLRAVVGQSTGAELPGRLLDAVAATRESRLTQVVAEPVLRARLDAGDWAGAAAVWRRAYPNGAPAESAAQGWRVAVGLLTAGDTAGAEAFLRDASLPGEGWLPALREWTGSPPAAAKVEGAAGAYRVLLKGRPATGAQTDLGRDLVGALARSGKADAAEQLWRTAILPAEVSPVTADASLQLFQGLLVAGGPKRALPAWRDWYRWDRLRPAFEVDGHPAIDDAHFALLKRMFSVALAVGPSPPELSEHLRKVRFARPRTLRIVAAIDRRIQDDAAWKEKTINRVDFASKQFQKAYGLKLEVVDFQFWVPRDEGGPTGAVEQLRARKAKAHADFIIGFILHVYPSSAEAMAMMRQAQIVGYASPEFGGTMVLRDMAFVDAGSVGYFPAETVNETITHELGHAFGALHTDDKASVMRQGFGAEPAYTFDKYNARVCQVFKEFVFDKGYEFFDEGELRELAEGYRGLRGKCRQGNGAEGREATLRFLLARRLRAQSRKGEAIEQFAKVIEIGEPKDLVKQARAEMTKLQAASR
jgi:hypothetical protein